jgi:superfamily II RNA helicase
LHGRSTPADFFPLTPQHGEVTTPPLAPPAQADADTLLSVFLDFTASRQWDLYPAQEEAILALLEDRHVVLNTPTGSGKSLVALALHFKCLARGQVSVYTSPIKALVNEKFFALCEIFGPDRVGMLTGDASINREAPILCCTAEILSNLALREGAKAKVDAVVMDEFHYYADRDRGVAWQLPLLVLEKAQFLLMSATLGDMAPIIERVEALTKRPSTIVSNVDRPVPLAFEYRLTPLHETISDLVAAGKSPIYLVNFTQRAAAEQAQNLTSVNLCSKEDKERIRALLSDFRFDSPYGKELQRFLRAGIGVHHAGLLPKYRRLVERMAQENLLRVVSGTDTLGVGVNIPLRTVLFTQLCKFDGEKTVILSARDFHQISGRAGRKGFDDQGYVVAQAPEHFIENLALEAKAAAGKKKIVKKKPPEKGYVHYDQQTFEKLQTRQPEALESRFEVTHGMLLNLLQRPEEQNSASGGGYRKLLEIIGRSHESEWHRRRHKKRAAVLFRALRHGGIVHVLPHFNAWPKERAGSMVAVDEKLQHDFSMHQTLSLYLVETLDKLDLALGTYPLDLLTLVESILENPRPVLLRQIDKAKGEKVAELKAQGMEYQERMEELEKVEYPKPNAEFIYNTFNEFAARHPWVGQENVRPKSIAREMYEKGNSFNDYIREYGLERSEGLLLRYLMDAFKTLTQSVPERHRNEDVLDMMAFLRVTLAAVDSSLLEEWEELRDPTVLVAKARHEPIPVRPFDIAADPKKLAARVRAEMHRVLYALARKEWDEAPLGLWDPEKQWTPAALEEATVPLFAEHGGIDTTPRARASALTILTPTGTRQWDVTQRLLGNDGDDLWMLDGVMDLTIERAPDAPLVTLRSIRT